ncbi:MAG: dedA protein [Candidatus Saccharibacteria bacterium]|nr:dedA protein [Candidatus Saccharibacteria bacterium]
MRPHGIIEVMFGISIESLLQSGGLLAVGAIIFAEGGLLAGFFLPGDTLLLSAGYFASVGKLPLGWLLFVVIVSGIIGDNTGYEIGKRAGRKLFRKEESTFFHPDQLKKAEDFYERHGVKTVLLARFVPVIRTFVPVVSGTTNMDRKKFALYNAVGVIAWGTGVTMLGYVLGRIIGAKVQNIDKYILVVILLVMAITIGPAAYHLIKAQVHKRKNS